MQTPASRDDAFVMPERPAYPKVKRLTMHISAHPARFFNEKQARGVIPDLFVVLLAARILCGYSQAAGWISYWRLGGTAGQSSTG